MLCSADTGLWRAGRTAAEDVASTSYFYLGQHFPGRIELEPGALWRARVFRHLLRLGQIRIIVSYYGGWAPAYYPSGDPRLIACRDWI